jgi:hypothetical protein
MWKKIFLSIGLVAVLIVGIQLFNISKNKKNEEENVNNIVQNETELSGRYVTDECLNEWSDYSSRVQEELQEASKILNDENRHYILRGNDSVINVYYINENNEEILYKVTDISIKYLGEEDIRELEKGIDVVGIQEVNKLLEDFE